jgi:hypothetical protein
MVNFKTGARGNSRDTSDTLVMLLFRMGESDVDGPGCSPCQPRPNWAGQKCRPRCAATAARNLTMFQFAFAGRDPFRDVVCCPGAVPGIETRKAMKALSLLVVGVAVLVAGVAVATSSSPAKADDQKCGWSSWPAPSPVPCGKQWAKSFEDCRKWMIDHGDTNVVAAWYCHSQGHTQ